MSDINLATIGMIIAAWGVLGVVGSFVHPSALWLAAPLVILVIFGALLFAIVAPIMLVYDYFEGRGKQ